MSSYIGYDANFKNSLHFYFDTESQSPKFKLGGGGMNPHSDMKYRHYILVQIFLVDNALYNLHPT